jgi:hypothetical protein
MAGLFVMAGCLAACRIVLRETGSWPAGILTMLLLGLTSASPAYSGYGANTEIFILPFMLGSYCLLLRDDVAPRFHVVAGLLIGIALAIKPVVFPVGMAGGIHLMLRQRKDWRGALASGAWYAAGCALPLLAIAGCFLAAGAFDPFIEAVWRYNAGYVSAVSPAGMLKFFLSTMSRILKADPVTWAAGLAGIPVFLLAKRAPRKGLHLGLLAGGAAAVVLGKYFYGHYFLMFVPFLAVGAGLGAGRLGERLGAAAAAVPLLVAIAASGAWQSEYFRMPPAQLLAGLHGSNPFYQSVALGNYLRERATPDGRLFVIGSEAQLLTYSGMRAPGRIFYFYPLTVPTALRSAFRSETLSALGWTPPEYLVYSNTHASHLLDPVFDRQFLSILARVFSDYELVAVSPFGSDAVVQDPAGVADRALWNRPGTLMVFRRPGSGPPVSGILFGKILAL